MRFTHSTRAVLAAVAAFLPVLAGAQPAAPAAQAESANFTIFVRSVPVGSEQVAVTQKADGWTLTSTGRMGLPVDAVARRINIRYDAEWRPLEMLLDSTIRGQLYSVHTLVSGTTATSEVEVATQTTEKKDTVAADAIMLPAPFLSPFAVVALRMRGLGPGSVLQGYSVPHIPVTIRIGESTTEKVQTPSGIVEARATHLILDAAGGNPLDAEIWTDAASHLLRFTVPAEMIDAVREDLASVASRRITISRPNDESVKVPANGFSLVGTLSKPATAGKGPMPAIVLAAGSGAADRDENTYGVPMFGQLAGLLADAGYAVLRYDKRAIGQSGGRADSSALVDYSEDLRAAVRYLADRKDIDPKRIAVVGHGEGGAVALLTASREKRVGAVVLMGATGSTGNELVLAQQKRTLDRMTLPDAEKQQKIELQQKINQAVLTGKGWEGIPPVVRRQVDNPEYQSILAFDPAKVMPDVSQPMLILHGTLDMQVAMANAERLEALAKARKKAPVTELQKIAGLNHLFVPATTGEVSEYTGLKGKAVAPEVGTAISAWLQKTLPPRK